jgi:hypothetical protein
MREEEEEARCHRAKRCNEVSWAKPVKHTD